jgi:hypothetical protein
MTLCWTREPTGGRTTFRILLPADASAASEPRSTTRCAIGRLGMVTLGPSPWEGVMMETRERFPVKNARVQRFAVYATVAFAAFLLGFLPMWLVARTRANERNAAQQALRLAEIENTLAAAAIQARRGEYEPARRAASTFYTNLRAELDRADSGFAEPSRDALQALLAERDHMITLLARSDPAVAERLANTYISYRQTAGTLPPQTTRHRFIFPSSFP